MILVKVFDKLDGGDGSQPNELMEPHKIYKEKVDMSRVPRIFSTLTFGGGLYEYPEDDIELLECCCRPSNRCYVCGKFEKTKVYHVDVEDDSCTADECIELLKKIGCENRFIACSVERANLFYAELNKDDAARLKGVKGILDVFPRGEIYFKDDF